MAVPTYVTHVGFAHTVDEKAYALGTTGGMTLVSGTPNYILNASNIVVGLSTANAFTPLANLWISCSLLRHEGQIATAATVYALTVLGSVGDDTLTIAFEQSTDNDHFKINIRKGSTGGTSIATGTKEIAVDTDFTLLIWVNGSTLRVKTDGTEDDINVSHSGVPNRTGIQARATNLGVGDKIRIGAIAIHHSNDEADRPGVDIGDDLVIYPNGDKLQAYGDHTDCDPGSTTGDYTEIDDWASGVVDDATFLCENASEGGYFLATMTTVTVTNNFTGCRFIIRNRASIAAKTINWQYTIRDNDGTPNEIQKNGQNLGSDVFGMKSMEFPLAPDGGAWSQGELDNANCGPQSNAGNGANDEHSVFMMEVCTIDLDPPPAVRGRRLLGQVV